MIGRLKIGRKVPTAIYTSADVPVCIVDTMGEVRGSKVDQEFARRLVACWNACEGITTDNLEANLPVKELATRYNANLRQRDELLARLRNLLKRAEESEVLLDREHGSARSLQELEDAGRLPAEILNARAAIAKVAGQQP